MDNPVTKDIDKWIGDLVYPNNTADDIEDFFLQNMQSIDFLVRLVQDLSNQGLSAYVTLLQSNVTNCTKLYKYVQHYLTHTKTKSDDSWLINLLEMKKELNDKLNTVQKLVTQNLVKPI